LAATPPPARNEIARILDFAQAAFGDLVGLLCGRDDSLLDSSRDGEWTLRDILRHAIAVELRYAAQVNYSATRADSDPIEIPPELLPCDRLAPPEPRFARSHDGGIHELVGLLELAREDADSRLGGLPDDALGRPSVWGAYRTDVRTRLHQIAAHLTETTIQIDNTIGDTSSSEAREALRRCCVIRGSHERWSSPGDRAALDERYVALAR
jgi:hypothetical protein